MQRLALAAVATCLPAPASPEGVEPGRAPVATVATAEPAPAGGRAETPEGLAVFGSAFAFAPLDTLRVTGGFGEVRAGHFHAGYDFSTGRRVGRPVRAPLAGRVERVRASGAGYGRSVYLRADDGRLLVFGHLDAFAPALAAHVDSAQRASGQYVRDLWPARGQFRFAAGETLAWSGESGAGPPHLHLEVRHGDFAMHPLRTGLVPGRVDAPRLLSLVLEPLDGDSRVAGGVSPRRVALRAGADTIEAEGRLRAVVRSASGLAGAGDAPAWSTRLEWGNEWVEARLDSISWAGEMSEIGLLVDRGRVAGTGGLVLYASPGFRPRFLRASAPESLAAGEIRVRRGDAPLALRLVAREPGGEPVERVVVLRPPAGDGPPPVRRRPRDAKAAAKQAEPAWSFTVLPGARLRTRVTGVPAGQVPLVITDSPLNPGSPVHWDGGGYTALHEPLDGFAPYLVTGSAPAGRDAWEHSNYVVVIPGESRTLSRVLEGASLDLGPGHFFEPGLFLLRWLPPAGARAQGLAPLGRRLRVWPETLPLRRALRLALPADTSGGTRDLGVYRRRGGGTWEWMGAEPGASPGALAAESGETGDFAVMRDTLAPVVSTRVPLDGPSRPYSRWQFVARVVERGSGLDASASGFLVDGARVPTEWDAEARLLRWRPLARPAPGRHRYEVRAVDRAGNATVRRGSFVLDSAGR